MKKLSLILAFLILFSGINFATEIKTDASYAIYDFTTNKILDGKNIDSEIAIASVTKLMTALLVYDAIGEGRLKMTDSYKYTQDELDLYLYGSDVNISLGTSVTVDELMSLLLIRSANSSAQALAKMVAGSESAFVQKMNARAKNLGMEKTRFINSHGLPIISTDDQNTSTIKDLAILIKELFSKYPEIINYTKKSELNLPRLGLQIKSTNPLLGYKTVDGLKTGTTNRAGRCLITTATEDAEGVDETRRVFAFLFGAKTDKERLNVSRELIDIALDDYVYKRVIGTDLVFKQELDPINFDEEYVKIIPEHTSDRLLNKKNLYKLEVKHNDPVEDSIEAGQVMGKLILTENGEAIDEVNLIAKTSIKRTPMLRRWWKKIKSWF